MKTTYRTIPEHIFKYHLYEKLREISNLILLEISRTNSSLLNSTDDYYRSLMMTGSSY